MKKQKISGLVSVFLICALGVQSQAAIPKNIPFSKVEKNNSLKQNYEAQKKIAFSKTESMQARWKAIMAMSDLKKKKSVIDLKKLSSQDEWFLKNASMVALNKVVPEQANQVATRLVQDKALVVRSMAVEILKSNMTAPVRKLFWSELEQSYNFRGDNSLWIRKQLIEALAQKPESHEEVHFSKYLMDRDPDVTKAAYKAYTENFRNL